MTSRGNLQQVAGAGARKTEVGARRVVHLLRSGWAFEANVGKVKSHRESYGKVPELPDRR